MTIYEALFELCSEKHRTCISGKTGKPFNRALQKRTFDKMLCYLSVVQQSSFQFLVSKDSKVNLDNDKLFGSCIMDSKHNWVCFAENEQIGFLCLCTCNEQRLALKKENYFSIGEGLGVLSQWLIEMK